MEGKRGLLRRGKETVLSVGNRLAVLYSHSFFGLSFPLERMIE